LVSQKRFLQLLDQQTSFLNFFKNDKKSDLLMKDFDSHFKKINKRFCCCQEGKKIVEFGYHGKKLDC